MNSTILIHISSGRGPAECERAVWLFSRWLEQSLQDLVASSQIRLRTSQSKSGLHAQTASYLELEIRVLQASAALPLQQRLAPYLGTVQWICPSQYRPSHRRKNWFFQVSQGYQTASTAALLAIKPADLRYETARSSGKGGQHVNKTETAVRLVHLPTGLSTIARDERSQLRNKETALARLQQLLAEQAQAQADQQKAAIRKHHDDLERGNALATFAGPEFRLIETKTRNTAATGGYS